ncbi:malonyl-CoA decarboxylase domain-containing protein [Cognatazoarcus halotolerans]|uniref:malonyl-CoA decarboxylase domain-containing protein n=1 Tax=Cognatazoarcus halotolerans TaxID=2686016 RepID=UPI00190F89D3|nr:malonyl-CoA decarboxylase family protein [Cognatazoarcus halotolerans]MCB1901443.1 malonyl-CoA decarboxylase family protein [Rhodocyclaceae bacterium]MCP5308175.1 malonyl-CoA decarboxylase family protein [Zoogloeaceae bacterium]
MVNNLVSRGLSTVRRIVSGKDDVDLSPRLLDKIRTQLTECVEGLGGEVSARQRAARLAHTYLQLDDEGRHAFLKLIALEFGPNPKQVAKAHESYQAAVGTAKQWDAEAGLRMAMRSRRIRILTQFNAIPQGVKFLVDMRVDLLRFLKQDNELQALDRELENRLSAWFDVGFLELQRITWNSPAALLEKLVEYEAVHEIRSWQDLKNRLDSDRRCYAFFHPRMPAEPLIFVEVALTDRLADNVQSLLDENAPVFDAGKADSAIFYSISNTQVGLRGVSFGNFLLKRVIEDLQRDFPKLHNFATLSPIPLLREWAVKNPQAVAEAFLPGDLKKLGTLEIKGLDAPEINAVLAGQPEWVEHAALADALKGPLTRIAAGYLLEARQKGKPYDPVARFHLGNGARVERLNWLGDTSAKGLAQSWGLMVNYLYDPDAIERNVETFAREQRVAASSAIRRQVRR